MFFTCLLSFLVNNNIILNKIVFYTIIIKVLPLQWHLGLKGLNLPQKNSRVISTRNLRVTYIYYYSNHRRFAPESNNINHKTFGLRKQQIHKRQTGRMILLRLSESAPRQTYPAIQWRSFRKSPSTSALIPVVFYVVFTVKSGDKK